MTKKQIISWLATLSNKKREEIRKQYEIKKEAYLAECFQDMKVKTICGDLNRLYSEMFKVFTECEDICKNDKLISDKWYWSIFLDLNKYTGSDKIFFYKIFYKESDYTHPKITDFYIEMQSELSKWTKHYHVLINNINTRKDAKTALLYLKEMGIDISELEEKDKPVTALAIKLDHKYLFGKPSKSKAA